MFAMRYAVEAIRRRRTGNSNARALHFHVELNNGDLERTRPGHRVGTFARLKRHSFRAYSRAAQRSRRGRLAYGIASPPA